jgi:tetratricopeptide (TPR) repeat protein
MISRRHIRVFISSPGDVREERYIARKVIDRLRVDPLLRKTVDLEAISWDDPDVSTPMLASITPQEAVNRGLKKPSECEIVVVILWARMGTPLPESYLKPDGSRYQSGTEWEYLDAVDAASTSSSGQPFVAIYRRSEAPTLKLDAADSAERIQQWERVQAFFAAFTNSDGSINRGYNSYDTPDDFGKLLEMHLKVLIQQVLEHERPDLTAPLPVTPVPGIFASPLRVALLLVFVALLTVGALGVRWLTTREVVMDGQFNIVVAQLALPENAPANAAQAFERIHLTIYNLLLNEYLNTGVQVARQQFGVVGDARDAEALAAAMRANIVIYADVEWGANAYKYTPRFFLASGLNNDMNEIMGDHDWLDETLTDDQLNALINDDSDERVRLELKSGILTQFTQALVYLSMRVPGESNEGVMRNAETAIRAAVRLAESYDERYGEDIPISIIYLFASTIYRIQDKFEQAQQYAELAAANPAYGRAQIALGHIMYDLGVEAYYAGDRATAFNDLNIARQYYTDVLQLSDQPLSAFVIEKAYISLGNTHQVLYQLVGENARPQFFEGAIAAYQAALDSLATVEGEWLQMNVRLLSAEAARQMGSMYMLGGQAESARAAYEQALEFSTDPAFERLIEPTLEALQPTPVIGA